MNIRLTAALLMLVPLTACAGGGTSPSANAPKGSATPQATGSPGASGSQSVSGSVSITIPSSMKTTSTKAAASHVRRPKFISPSTESVSIAVNGGTPMYADVSASSSYCTAASGTSRTCTIPIAAPVGATTISLSLLDEYGTVLGSGQGTTTATLGQAFSLTITINPVAASIAGPTLSYSPGTSLAIGTAGTASFTPAYADPDGNAIPASATFATPLSVSISDTNVTVSPASVTSASQAITLSYNGSTAVAGSITLTITTSTGSTLTTVGTVTLEPGYAPPVTVTTFAGSGAEGFGDGPGASATFSFPFDVAVDGTGNVYVADYDNSAIRKISPAGVVSTLAGTGTQGFTNGPVATATFDAPEGVAVDSAGNVYVADTFNEAIREISAAGVVSTFAGGSYGFTNGSGTSATFYNPNGIAVDSAGNVYVADAGNNAIRKITPAGVVSTLAGTGALGFANGPGSSATFANPYGVAVDGSGNVYVGDANNEAIRKISAAGVVSTFAGTGALGFANGPAASATFSLPQGVAVDSTGNVYVVDRDNDAIRKITPAGVVSTLAGGGGGIGLINGPAAVATFYNPIGVAVDSAGNVYVADYGNNLIRKITP